MNLTLNQLTEQIMFGLITTGRELEEKIKNQWEYRSNKGFEDVNVAIQKGLKMGHGKTEREIECVEMYLESVFKKVKSIFANNNFFGFIFLT